MKTKRIILMMQVALMSATGAWATPKDAEYTGKNASLTSTDENSDVCTHSDCTIYPFKAPSCLGTPGNVEYGKCNNSLCGKYFLTSDRNIVTTNVKDFTLSSKAVNIGDHRWNNLGYWGYSSSKDNDGTTYHNVMELSLQRQQKVAGDYGVSYTVMDNDPTMNLHLFFNANMGYGSFSVRFYVNGVERTALSKEFQRNMSGQHEIVAFDGLNRYDRIKVVFTYNQNAPNGSESANLFIGTEKALPASHNDLQMHEFCYNCIDGGHQDYYYCDRCTNVFTQNTPESDENITTLSDLALAPVGAHNFETIRLEGNLYGDQCQNMYCTTFDPDKYVLKNYHNGTDMPVSFDGNSYTAKELVSLTDAKEYDTSVAFSAANMEYSRTFFTNVWNPWFVPFTTTVEELAANGVTDVAAIESIHNYDMDEDGVVDKTVLEVILRKNGTVKAGVPYIVKTGDSYTYPMTFTDMLLNTSTDTKNLHSETVSAAYDFMGTYSGLTADEVTVASIYSLNSEGAMVHRTGSILPQRWYMQEVSKESVYEELSPAMARAFSIRVIGEENMTTGIRTIYPEDKQKEERIPEGIFDLSGRKLSAPLSGKVNIINGKKQFVK